MGNPSRTLYSILTCGCCFCIFIATLAIILPIGIINSIPPQYCYSTDHLKYLPIGSSIVLQKEFNSVFVIFNGTVNDPSRQAQGKMKYRSWAFPYRIDLMNADALGSCEGAGTAFSLGHQVELSVCQNDTEIPFRTFGRIEQEFTFLLRKYKMFNSTHDQVAHVEENLSFVTKDFDIKSPDGSIVYAKVATIPFANFFETWQVTVKAELPDFDWRIVMYLISVVSYNRN